MGCSADVLFLIAARAALPVVIRVVSAHRAGRPDSFPPDVVPCTRRAQRRAVLRERLAPVLGSAPGFLRVLVLARAQEWAALRVDLSRRRERLRVRSVQAAGSSAAAVSNIQRPKKAR